MRKVACCKLGDIVEGCGADPCGPDPHDRLVSKKHWETSLQNWRDALKEGAAAICAIREGWPGTRS